jgi:hypothetical protein
VKAGSALVLSLATLPAGSCGGDGMQMCGADHCGLKGHTIVKWTLDAYPQWLFPMDSCVDFNVAKVNVEAVDANGTTIATQADDCGAAQVTFDGLPDGDYIMYVTPRDFGGADLVTAPTAATVTAGMFGADTMVTANIPWDSWIGTFTGTFLFRLSWGGVTCTAAAPMVVKELLTLTVNGNAVHVSTDHGTMLDGSAPAPCYDLMANFPETATGLPFGPATLDIDGLDGSGSAVFHHKFDTFVGAGITNPTITYDTPPPDAM